MTALTLSYYPGCSLHGSAREYDLTTRAVCEAMGITLNELPDWSCCGASSAHRTDAELAIELPGRNLRIAAEQGHDLLIPCAACYNRTLAANAALDIAEAPTILSLPDLLADPEMLSRLTQRIVRPLDSLPLVAYYGCLLTRPAKITGATAPMNPRTMDNVLAATGAEVRRWSCKTTCCGASFTLAETGIVERLCTDLAAAAIEAGAKAIAVACPMCAANLDTRQQSESKLPVVFITELLALAMGLDDVAGKCWSKHRVPVEPVLSEFGLIDR